MQLESHLETFQFHFLSISIVRLIVSRKNFKMRIFYISFLTSIYFQAANSESYANKNLIFVYDVMSPGVDYLEFVQGVGKIYNELFQPGPYQIFNKLLVVLPFKTSVEIYSFNDTNNGNTVVEKLLNDKSVIEQEKTVGNVSRVLTGLWQGLYNGEPNSIIYVFTNANPEDKPTMYEITCAIENKMFEVGFVIQQNYPERDIPEEYETISTHANGLILNMHEDSQIMTFLSTLLTSTKNKVNLMTINNVFNAPHTILVDNFLDEITIAIWTFGGVGQYITYHYNYHQFEYSECEEKIICTNEAERIRYFCSLRTKIESFEGLCLSDLLINVDTNSHRYGLRIFGVSKFNFDYGFSVYENNCKKTMDKRPITNVLNYIYVRSTNEEYGAVFKSLKIIATDNSFAREISLQRNASSQDDFYYGTFVSTSQTFYIQVTALIDGHKVQRMSSFAITPIQQSPSEYNNNIEISPNYSNTNNYGAMERLSSNNGNSTYYHAETDQTIKFIN